MSDKETDGDEQSCPSISEIGMILQQLDLSPIHSDNESDDIILTCELQSTVKSPKNFSESEESSRAATITIDELDRDELLNKLFNAKKEEAINEMKNNWFHENLVKHFMKKQMIHVYCNDEIDNDTIFNEYMKKLFYFDSMKRKLRLNNEKWESELSKLRLVICEEREKANVTLERMISRGKTIGSCMWNHGQLFSDTSAQELISKQLEKIKEISRYRFHCKKLCDDLISIEENLNCLTAVSENLTNDNHKRLEAEKFYYQLELKDKKSKCEQLIAQNIILKDEMNLMCSKVIQINKKITKCKKILDKSRQTIDKLLHAKRLTQNKLVMKKKFIHTLEGILCNKNNRIDFKLSEIRREHDEWLRKIENALRIISHTDENLNALKTNLILQEKNISFKNIDNNQ